MTAKIGNLLPTLAFVAVLFIALAKARGTAAATTPTCTNLPQAGIAQVEIDENGHSLTLIPRATPLCGPYSVTITPQGSGSAAAKEHEALLAEFDVERYFVDTFDLNAFVIGAKGQPGAVVIFQWTAIPRTQ